MTDPAADARDADRCRAVLIELLAAIDHGRATEALELFTDDACFAARGERLEGRAAIRDFLARREAETHRQTAHVIANDVADQIGDRSLWLRATVILYVRRAGGDYVAGRILDSTQTFRRTDSGWRISRRDVSPLHDDAP